MEWKKYKKKRIVPKEWEEFKVSDIFETSSGATPTSTNKEYYDNGNIPWINSGELSSPYIYEANNFITQKGYDSSSTKLYPIDTVLVAMYGATAGKASLLKIEACTNQAICAILANPKYNPSFIKYSIDVLYAHLVGLSSGSARDNLSQEEIGKLKLIAPKSLEYQNAIVAVLSTLDRKIALNKRINHNLEAMAKQLYDYWFVQFDFPNAEGKPYKSSGGKMVWNEELGKPIPEHWEVKLLQDIAIVRKGSIITEKQATQGNVKVVAGGITFSYYNGQSNRPQNTITVSGSGANAGYINFWREPIFASDCTTVNCEDDLDTLLCLYGMQHFQEVLYNWAVGAAQPHVYPKQVGILPMVCVPIDIKQRIKQTFLSINKQIGVNLVEIEKLTKQRDELLPLLMNGQATVNSD